MKQLSALGARRHAFFRSPRRMRPLGGRLDESEMLGSTPYTYYGGEGPSVGALPHPRVSPPPPPPPLHPSLCPFSLCSFPVPLLPGEGGTAPAPRRHPCVCTHACAHPRTQMCITHTFTPAHIRAHMSTQTRPRTRTPTPPPPAGHCGGGAAAPLPRTKPQLRGFCAPFRPHLFQLPPGPAAYGRSPPPRRDGMGAAGRPRRLPRPRRSLQTHPPIGCVFKASPPTRGFPGTPCCPAVSF